MSTGQPVTPYINRRPTTAGWRREWRRSLRWRYQRPRRLAAAQFVHRSRFPQRGLPDRTAVLARRTAEAGRLSAKPSTCSTTPMSQASGARALALPRSPISRPARRAAGSVASGHANACFRALHFYAVPVGHLHQQFDLGPAPVADFRQADVLTRGADHRFGGLPHSRFFARLLASGLLRTHVEAFPQDRQCRGIRPNPWHQGILPSARQRGHDVPPQAPRAPQLPRLDINRRLGSQSGSLTNSRPFGASNASLWWCRSFFYSCRAGNGCEDGWKPLRWPSAWPPASWRAIHSIKPSA